MKRTDIINHIILHSTGYKGTYLEIGLNRPEDNYFNVLCANKECVDPMGDDNLDFLDGEEKRQWVIDTVLTHRMTSDEFFEQNTKKYDVIFIDGLHLAEQVHKDIVNAYNCLNPGGFIVIHDCLPLEEEHQKIPRVSACWNGDVWKAIPNLYKADISFVVVDTDSGCGVIKYTGPKNFDNYNIASIEYNELFTNHELRNAVMHVVSPEEFFKM